MPVLSLAPLKKSCRLGRLKNAPDPVRESSSDEGLWSQARQDAGSRRPRFNTKHLSHTSVPSPHSPTTIRPQPSTGSKPSVQTRLPPRLPTSSTLYLIPDNLPVSSLESYFRRGIRIANSTLNLLHIVEGLGKAKLVDTQAVLLFGDVVPGEQGGRNRRVLVGRRDIAGLCHERLGNGCVAC